MRHPDVSNPTRREALAAGMAGWAVPARAVSGGRPPNLVFLLTDDQRWDTLGVMGNPIIRTPNLDALGRDGVVFENNFCSTSICMTSRASFFSGLYERSHGISNFATPFSPEALAATYPARLRTAGYRTGFIGKYGVGAQLPRNAFDYFEAFPGQGRYFPSGENGPHLTRIQTGQAREFLEGCRRDQPFCLSISFKAPHVQDEDPRQFLSDPAHGKLYADIEIPLPATAAPRYYDGLPEFLKDSEGRRRWKLQFADPAMAQRSMKNYYRLISGVDEAAGAIVASLRERGLLDNTVIVFTGDNGYFLGEHGLSHKWYLYEESIRTPLLVWDPRLPWRARGQRRREMTLNIDIAPTLLDLAGLDATGMQGRALTPLVAGSRPRWRAEWFYSHLFEHPLIPKSEGIRTPEWSYIRWIGREPVYEQLFHLRRDPHNTRNLAGSPGHAKRLERMRSRSSAWRAALDRRRPGEAWRDPA